MVYIGPRMEAPVVQDVGASYPWKGNAKQSARTNSSKKNVTARRRAVVRSFVLSAFLSSSSSVVLEIQRPPEYACTQAIRKNSIKRLVIRLSCE